VHSLRVSLDYLMWQLVISEGLVPNRTTKFPIVSEPRHDIYPGISMDLRMIIDEVQPYQRTYPASHELAILRELDNKDKHRALLVAILGVRQPALGWWGDYKLPSFSRGPYSDPTFIKLVHTGLAI